MPYLRVALVLFFVSDPVYKIDRSKIKGIIKKLKKKGYEYMYEELVKNWDDIIDAGSTRQCINGEDHMTKKEVKKQQEKWANNVKLLTPKKGDGARRKYFFWEKVACICHQILAPSGTVSHLDFFFLNDNNKLLLNLDNKLNRLPRWVNIGDEINTWKNFKIKRSDLPWGTSWSLDTINIIDNALQELPEKRIPTSIRNNKITITSLSPEYGYRLLGSTHKTGLDIDFRVISTDGKAGRDIYSKEYDQGGQRFFLKLLNVLNKSKKINIRSGKPVLNDEVLIGEGLCVYVKGHHNHVHLQTGEPSQ